MRHDDKRKINNRKEAVKTSIIIAVIIAALWYFGVKTDIIILGLLILCIGVLTYFMLDYDNNIEDIQNKIDEFKK